MRSDFIFDIRRTATHSGTAPAGIGAEISESRFPREAGPVRPRRDARTARNAGPARLSPGPGLQEAARHRIELSLVGGSPSQRAGRSRASSARRSRCRALLSVPRHAIMRLTCSGGWRTSLAPRPPRRARCPVASSVLSSPLSSGDTALVAGGGSNSARVLRAAPHRGGCRTKFGPRTKAPPKRAAVRGRARKLFGCSPEVRSCSERLPPTRPLFGHPGRAGARSR
jgi:hypothetical protein